MPLKIIAFGDIHHGPNFEQIESAIERENPDRVIFIGDYFDKFNDHTDHAYLTAKWLKASLGKANRVHLWGNHDLPYRFDVYCPGFRIEKKRAINAVLDDQDWRKLKLWHLERDWLFSHAGLSQQYAPIDLTALLNFLETEERSAWDCLSAGRFHWIWSIGRIRGGTMQVGGLIWCDWENEFTPISGLNQVLGHSPGPNLRLLKSGNCENWCIDVTSPIGISRYLVIEAGRGRMVEIA